MKSTGANRPPHSLVIVFGATGDLNRRKLLPALYQLSMRGFLDGSHILGVARSAELNDQSFRALAREVIDSIPPAAGSDESGSWCDQCLHFHSIGEGGEQEYRSLASKVEELQRRYHLTGNRVFYLALPPQAFASTIRGIGRSGLHQSGGWTRIVVEKPFGRDLKSAIELNELVHSFFDESQVYRIDHYLGKETVQNLLIFRFANPIFESLWNRDRIDNVQITVAEELGVESRAAYYDRTGALRDMVQNHLSQLLSLIAMEVPCTLDAEAVRDEKAKVLRSIAPIKPENVVFGQYAGGQINGSSVRGYLEEPGVPPQSRTETMVAMKLDIVNWRWNGVPFYLRTGKRLPARTSEVAIVFRKPPVSVFQPFGTGCNVHSNALIITIQPGEGFRLKFQVKKPGQPVKLATQHLAFQYDEVFSSIPDGYETLLQDILLGEQSLFVRSDWIELSWRLYNPLLQSSGEVHPYAAGSWGPPEADQLLVREGRSWL